MSRAEGERRTWTAPNRQAVDLPVTVDLVHIAPDRSVVFAITAVVDLHGGQPRLTGVAIDSDHGLDHVRLQRQFRWATPLDIVRRAVPALLERGIDPFDYDFPADGYPAAADLGRPQGWALTDDFLEEIAHRYLELGRGYAQTIAFERGVAPRTAVSWVEKARARGILTRVSPGSHGGRVLPPEQRRHGVTGSATASRSRIGPPGTSPVDSGSADRHTGREARPETGTES